MDNEEVLSQERIIADGRGGKGIYTSKSADVFANNGLRGKLTEDQLDERAILHAKRQQTGSPSIVAIIKQWNDKYGITMSAPSEYEWARNNQKRIDIAISKLEENGDMPIITVPDSTVTATLASGAKNAVDLMRTNKRTMQKIGSEIEDTLDWCKIIGVENKEDYYSGTDEQKKEWDKRLKLHIDLRSSNVSVFNALSRSSTEHGKFLVDTMKAVSDINKGGQQLDSLLEKRVNDAIKDRSLKIAQHKETLELDPLTPVSDDERIK